MSASQALKFVPVVAAFALSGCSSDDSSSSNDCTWTSTDNAKTVTVEFSSGKVSKIKSVKCSAAGTAVTDSGKLTALLADNTIYTTNIDTCDKFKTLLATAANDPCTKSFAVSVVDTAGKDGKMKKVKAHYANLEATAISRLTGTCPIGAADAEVALSERFGTEFLADSGIFATAESKSTPEKIKAALAVTAVAEMALCDKYIQDTVTITGAAGKFPPAEKTITVGWRGKKSATSFTIVGLSTNYCGTPGTGITTDDKALTNLKTALTGDNKLAHTNAFPAEAGTENATITAWLDKVAALTTTAAGSRSIIDPCATEYCPTEVGLSAGTSGAKVRVYISGGNYYIWRVTCSAVASPNQSVKAATDIMAFNGGAGATDGKITTNSAGTAPGACPSAGTNIGIQKYSSSAAANIVGTELCGSSAGTAAPS